MTWKGCQLYLGHTMNQTCLLAGRVLLNATKTFSSTTRAIDQWAGSDEKRPLKRVLKNVPLGSIKLKWKRTVQRYNSTNGTNCFNGWARKEYTEPAHGRQTYVHSTTSAACGVGFSKHFPLQWHIVCACILKVRFSSRWYEKYYYKRSFAAPGEKKCI